MKLLLTLTLLFTSALAAPANLEVRQLIGGSTTSNDFVQGGCKDVIMIYARASSESGNIGSSLGPSLKSGLNSRYRNNFAMQGVDYPASLADNFLPGGTTQDAINTMANLLTRAANECPSARIVAGGYSQGTAVTAGAISRVSASVRDRVVGVVLFGYTQNQQNRRGIPNYPSSNLKVYCATGDLVCSGTLTITLAHFSYAGDVNNAVSFLAGKIGRI